MKVRYSFGTSVKMLKRKKDKKIFDEPAAVVDTFMKKLKNSIWRFRGLLSTLPSVGGKNKNFKPTTLGEIFFSQKEKANSVFCLFAFDLNKWDSQASSFNWTFSHRPRALLLERVHTPAFLGEPQMKEKSKWGQSQHTLLNYFSDKPKYKFCLYMMESL